jgi:metal-dependent hydrolase (beta-lactamase superfamily II)
MRIVALVENLVYQKGLQAEHGLSFYSVGISHCTGVEKFAELGCHFKDRVFYNATGNEVLVNA